MKVSELISKLRQLPPDSDVKELDVILLFNDNTVARELDKKLEILKGYLARGDLEGLRKFVEIERATLEKKNIEN